MLTLYLVIAAASAGGLITAFLPWGPLAARNWTKIAEALGLPLPERKLSGPSPITGTIDRFSVSLDSNGAGVFIRVDTGEELPPELTISCIDATQVFEAPEPIRTTALTPEVLQALDRLAQPVSLKHGRVTMFVEDMTWSNVVPEIRRLLDFVIALSFERTPMERRAIACLAASDDIGTQRLLLGYLFQGTVDREIRSLAIDFALDSGDPEQHLIVAPYAGERGLAVVKEIALDEYASDFLRARAIRMASTLEVGELLDLIPRTGSFSRESIAQRLGLAGDRRAEQALIDLLHDPGREVRIAAAIGLGRVGTIRAVAPLLELADGVLAIGRLSSAARDAINKIQARTGIGDRGQLSISADPLAGAVAVAPAQPGAISYAGDEESDGSS